MRTIDWALPTCVVACVGSAWSSSAYADAARVSAVARAHAIAAWALALAIVTTVPFDVSATMSRAPGASDDARVGAAWESAYWLAFAATFVTLPLHQSYEDAGDFTASARLRRAGRENAAVAAAASVACAIGAVALLATEKLSFDGMRAYAIVLANVWGISTGLLFTGFGLVDAPRSLWRRASYAGRVSRALRRVAGASRALSRDYERLALQAKAVETTSGVMPRRHELRWAMNIIEKETPDISTASVSEEQNDCLEYDYDELTDLVALRRSVMRASRVYRRTRALYVIAVEEAFRAEALEASRASSMRRLHRPPNSGVRSGPLGKCLDDIEYTWSIIVFPFVMRSLAVAAAFLSVCIIVAESTIWIGRVWETADQVSFLSVMLENAENTSTSPMTSMQVVVAIPLFYMCFCCFYSICKVSLFAFYQLVPRATDSISLLVNASLVCRYAAPLSYNFLMLLPIIRSSGRMTTFTKKMVSNVPELADELNIIVPTFLGLFCMAVAFGWFERIIRVFKADSFKFEADADVNESVDVGKSIVDRERAEVMDGGVIGRTHEAFISDNETHEQRLPPPTETEENETHDSRGLLTDPETANARWETQKARLSQAMQQTMSRSAARGSPLSQIGRDKVSKLDSMFSNFSPSRG